MTDHDARDHDARSHDAGSHDARDHVVATGDAVGRAAWRRALEPAVPALAVAIAVVAPLALLGRLPDPVASHWSITGQVDGRLPLALDVVLLAVTTAVVAAGPLAVARVPVARLQARLLVATAWSVATLLAVLRVVTLAANLDAATWRDAGALDLRAAAIALVATAAAGVAGWLVAGDRPDLAVATTPATRVAATEGGTAVWSGGASNRAGAWLPIGLAVVAAVTVALAPPGVRIVTLVTAVVVVLATSTTGEVRVTVGPRGLKVGLGLLGWPHLRVRIEDVEEVAVEDVAPMAYGGWGVRTVPTATAVVIRRGPGIRVGRRGRRPLVVTVEDAATAAGVLLAHRDATGTPASA